MMKFFTHVAVLSGLLLFSCRTTSDVSEVSPGEAKANMSVAAMNADWLIEAYRMRDSIELMVNQGAYLSQKFESQEQRDLMIGFFEAYVGIAARSMGCFRKAGAERIVFNISPYPVYHLRRDGNNFHVSVYTPISSIGTYERTLAKSTAKFKNLIAPYVASDCVAVSPWVRYFKPEDVRIESPDLSKAERSNPSIYVFKNLQGHLSDRQLRAEWEDAKAARADMTPQRSVRLIENADGLQEVQLSFLPVHLNPMLAAN